MKPKFYFLITTFIFFHNRRNNRRSYRREYHNTEFIQAEYSLSDTPAVSSVEKTDGKLYTVSLNTIVTHNVLEKLPVYTVPANNDEE